MRIAYFDCVGGVSGDMLLSALLDAGASETMLRGVITALNLSDCDIQIEQVMRGALAACQVMVITPRHEIERHLVDLIAIINHANVSEAIKQQAAAIIRRIAEVESSIHNCPLESIHLHEVGGDDTLIDVVGVLSALEELQIERVYTSSLPLAEGMIQSMHGLIPLPAPATLALLKDVPVRYVDSVEAELVTPTGAALISSLVHEFGGFPSMRIKTVGIGAGHRDLPFPNVVRVWIAETLVEPNHHSEKKTSLSEAKESEDHSHAHDHPHEHAHDHSHEQDHVHPHVHEHIPHN
jgi:pyridinium-3,5-bisthiocarboxylic acid mononucleotide nickel chelatase